MAAWNASVSGSSWVRRRSSTGVRSAPPPNQGFVVTTKRVFMCTVGTLGFQGWAISEIPEAQKRGSSSEPGIWPRNSGAIVPCTVEMWTPAFSNTRPRSIAISPPPPGAPAWSARAHGVRSNRPGAVAPGSNGPSASVSRTSRAAQMRSRSALNQSGVSAWSPATAFVSAASLDNFEAPALKTLADDPDHGGLHIVAARGQLQAMAAARRADVGMGLLRLDGRPLGIGRRRDQPHRADFVVERDVQAHLGIGLGEVAVKLRRIDREQALDLKARQPRHRVDDAVLLGGIVIGYVRSGEGDRDVVAVLEGDFHPGRLEGLDARRHRQKVSERLIDRAEVEAEQQHQPDRDDDAPDQIVDG